MANKNTKKKQTGGGDNMSNIIQAILEMKVILFLPANFSPTGTMSIVILLITTTIFLFTNLQQKTLYTILYII